MRIFMILSAIVASGLAIGSLSIESSSRASSSRERLNRPASHLPATVAPVLQRACRDCHSNETAWPWYSRVPPLSFMIEHDVRTGRAKFNFSSWASGSSKPTPNQIAEICDAASDGSMPPRGYRMMHSDAKLSTADVDALCKWSTLPASDGPANSAGK